jgi:hypothetical protein
MKTLNEMDLGAAHSIVRLWNRGELRMSMVILLSMMVISAQEGK